MLTGTTTPPHRPYFDALFPSGSYTCDSKTENCCYCMYDGLYTTDNFFADIPDGIWWSFVTIFTVGYGMNPFLALTHTHQIFVTP